MIVLNVTYKCKPGMNKAFLDKLNEEGLGATCRAEDGEIMGIRHKHLLIEGIQYHPESILTINGKTQIGNFLKMVRAAQPKAF